MKPLMTLIWLVLIASLELPAQSPVQGQLKGRLIDEQSSQPLFNARVALSGVNDSLPFVIIFTGQDGNFLFRNIKNGSFRVHISYLGYRTFSETFNVTGDSVVKDMGDIRLYRSGLTLAEVEVRQRRAVAVKKDTLEYDASFFKTRENALMGKLIEKLPGAEVGSDGSITINGRQVYKLLIDGMPYFGDDPKIALRNLPADIVDKIQVIDKDARDAPPGTSGKERFLNITTKKSARDALLGSIAVGQGTFKRFGGNLNLNRFGQARQLSLIGGVSNSGMPGGELGSGLSPKDMLDGSPEGLTRIWQAGFSYSEKLGSKISLGSSYYFNNTRTENQRIASRQNILQDSTFYYNQDAAILNTFNNNVLNTKVEYEIDSLHFLSVNTGLSYYTTGSLQSNRYESLNDKLAQVNAGWTENRNEGEFPGFHGELMFKKKFRRKGREFSAAFNAHLGNVGQDAFSKSMNNFFVPGGILMDSTNQYSRTKGSNSKFNYWVIYHEPLFRETYLELTYVFDHSNNNSDKRTFNYNAGKGIYDLPNDSLSNSFNSSFVTNRFGLFWGATAKKFGYSVGMVMQNSKLTSENLTNQAGISQRTVQFSPMLSFNYEIGSGRRFGFRYYGLAESPAVQQLQPVPDNSNPLYVQLGNPGLQPSFNNSFSLEYTGFNTSSMRSLSVYLQGTITSKKIVTATWLDSVGRQLSQPKNENGYFNIGANITGGLPLWNKEKLLRSNTRIYLARDISLVNGSKGFAYNYILAEFIQLPWSWKDILDMNLTAAAKYNGSRYTTLNNNGYNYFTYSITVDGQVKLPFNINLGVDMGCLFNGGQGAGYDMDIVMLNAFISKSLLKRGQGLIRLQGNDLLGQTQSVRRNIGNSFIEDVRSTTLRQFFMLSFSWFIKPPAKDKPDP